MPRRPHVRVSVFPRSLRRAVLLAAALVPGLAAADVEWHPDLDTAQAAARISHRPVLAVFVADRDVDTAAFEAACLGSPEAEAVLATCFEPVRVHIDERPDLARAAGVTHVPSACVLSTDDAPLARLDAPNSPAAFVTAAIIAAQRVAAEYDANPLVADAGRPAPAGASAGTSARVGTTARGSLARVTAKVRTLSAFAGGQPQSSAPELQATVPAPAMTAKDAPAMTAKDAPAKAAADAWPAETADASSSAVAGGSAIEPAASVLAPSTTSPWLDAPAQPSVEPHAGPAPQPAQPPGLAAAPAAPPPTSAALPAPSTPEPPKASWQSRFIAAVQKPFGWGSRTADPPTVPPALPRGPLMAAVEPAPPAAPESAPEADPHGSMPLGLEGYCPVTLVDRGTWTEGRAQWGARHRGRNHLATWNFKRHVVDDTAGAVPETEATKRDDRRGARGELGEGQDDSILGRFTA